MYIKILNISDGLPQQESTLLAEHEWPAFIPDWLSTSNLIETHRFDAPLVKE